jgi:hypothetical protein
MGYSPTIVSTSQLADRSRMDSIDDQAIKSLIAAEVERQLDKERAIIKEASGIALKIIAGAFALLLAIFTVFGLTTWKDVAKETTSYMKVKVDDLIQKADAETSVKQTLNDLVNRTIVAAELTAIKRGDGKLVLPKYEWDRLRSWLKTENLGSEEFSDALAILGAQGEERKKADANGFLSEMLNPTDASPYRWIRKQPEKRTLILSNFKHVDMGASAFELARSTTLSQETRIAAVKYLGDVNYVDSFEGLLALSSKMEDGELKMQLLVTCAKLRPAHSAFTATMKALVTQSTPNALMTSANVVQQLAEYPSFASDDGNVVSATLKQLLSFILKNGGFISIEYLDYTLYGRNDVYATGHWKTTLWVPTDKVGGARSGVDLGPPRKLQNLEQYWELLREAANAGDEPAMRNLVLRPSFRPAPSPEVSVQLGLGSTSEIVVKVDSDEKQRILTQKDTRDVLLSSASRNGGALKVHWVDQEKRTLEGTVVQFDGANFSVSLWQSTTKQQP